MMKSVYSTLFLDTLKPGKFQISVRNAANGRCLVDMYIPPMINARACVIGIMHIFCVRLLHVCSFY